MTDRDALILNVHENLAARYIVTRMLRNAGFHVVEAAGGERALELARGTPQPDVIVLDVRLPDLDGIEVCRRLKSSTATAPIKVLHTSAATITPAEKIQGIEVGADGYLTQPFEPQELIATVRSLLRLRRAEAELRERAERLADADRRKDEFLAMLGHELRNPLAAITSAIPLLAKRPPRDPLEGKARDVIDRQTHQLARLVDDLLEVARVTRGAIELRIERVELRTIVQRTITGIRETRSTAPERQIIVELGDTPVSIAADAARVEQILANLVDNALEHTFAGGTITVALRVTRAEDRGGDERAVAELRVRDDGVGIAAEAVPKLFATFYQVEPGLARTRGGLGVGLALVKRLAELHGGTVSASSEGLGRGSEFVVQLPLAAGAALVEDRRSALAGERASSLRVLLAMRDADAGEMLRDLLGLWGHQAEVVTDGQAGLEAFAGTLFDLALVDVDLSNAGDLEIGRRMRDSAVGRAPTLIALGSAGGTDDLERARRAGFDRHVATPIDGAGLRDLIERVTRG